MKNKFIYFVLSAFMMASTAQAMTDEAFSRFFYDEEHQAVVHQVRSTLQEEFKEDPASPLLEYQHRVGEIEAFAFGAKQDKYSSLRDKAVRELDEYCSRTGKKIPTTTEQKIEVVHGEDANFIRLLVCAEITNRKMEALNINRLRMHEVIPSVLSRCLKHIYDDPNIFESILPPEEVDKIDIDIFRRRLFIVINWGSSLEHKAKVELQNIIGEVETFFRINYSRSKIDAYLLKQEQDLERVTDPALKKGIRQFLLGNDKEYIERYVKQVYTEYKRETFKLFLITLIQYQEQRKAEIATQEATVAPTNG